MALARRAGLAVVLAAALLAPVSAPASATPPHIPSVPSPAPSAPAAPAVVDPEDPLAGRGDLVNVVVMLADQPASPSETQEQANVADQEAMLADWSSRFELTVDRQFGYLVNGFSATMPASQMLGLSLEPQVESVRLERVYEHVDHEPDDQPWPASPEEAAGLLPTEHSAIGAHGVPTAFESYGTDGTGTVIAIIDSGVDPSHPDLRLDDCAAAKIQVINPAPEAGFTCKVPNGYNYADESYVVADTTSSQHGQHVAGIAAANGSPGTDSSEAWAAGRIDGAAPNAQLLAMKVFSNNPDDPGARDSDIIAAIEDSVKLGADVINMSLGSDNGHDSASEGTWRALAKAREAGILATVAAGNDGQNYSLNATDTDALGLLDDGPLNSPGSGSHAFTIGSIDNTAVSHSRAYYATGGAEIPTVYSLQSGTADDLSHPLVDVGLGRPQDYAPGADLTGAYALIERGEITFAEKFRTAIEHGAEGVIVFNHEAGGEALVAMSNIGAMPVPGGSVPRSVGLALRASLAAGGPATIRLSSRSATVPNPTALQASDFTSWGPTPSLGFKPQVSGIGGSVLSTVYANGYGTKSGTSMAAPNVAGLSALLLQDYAQRFPQHSAVEHTRMVQLALMNTAQIPLDPTGVPFAPRQIGAGLARVDLALATPVLASVEGEGAAALGELEGPREITVTLTSYSDTDTRYTLPSQQVIGESNEAGTATTTHLSPETLTPSVGEVTVPAGGTATVTFTLTPDTASQHFIQGWARLTSATAGAPDLAVPYLGFVGDWDAEPIIAAPGQTLPSFYDRNASTTELLTLWGGQLLSMGGQGPSLAVSPNGDGLLDLVVPSLLLMRNASDVEYSVLDSEGRTVRILGQEQGLSRHIGADFARAQASLARTATSYRFNGTVWDPAAAADTVVPDGEYTYRVRSRLHSEGQWQTVDMPFTIDATAPELRLGAAEGTSLPLTVVEEGSGLIVPPTAVSADGQELAVTATGESTYMIQVPAGTPYITVSAVDGGFNTATATAVLGGTHLVLPDAEAINGSILGPSSPLVTDGHLTVSGLVSAQVARVSAAGQDAPVASGAFTAKVPLSAGSQEIEVVAYDAQDAVLESTTLTVTYDGTPPTLSITGLNEDGQLPVAADGTVTVSGVVGDERAGAVLTATVAGTNVPVAADGRFTHTLTPAQEDVSIPVVVSDGASTTSQDLPIAGRAQQQVEPDWTAPTFTSPDCRSDLTACFVSSQHPDATASSFTLRGTMGDASRLTLTPSARLNADGSDTAPAPIEASPAADGTFAMTLPASTGYNDFRLQVWDDQGVLVIDQSFSLSFDIAEPTLAFSSPTLYDGVLYTSRGTVAFEGTAEDDGWGYELAINSSRFLDVYDRWGIGPESNQRSFSHEVAVADGDTILVEARDSIGNALAGTIPVVRDQQSPTATISSLQEGERVSDSRVLTATATDEHLATARVTLDGRVLTDMATPAASRPGPVENVLTVVGAPAPAPDEAAEEDEEGRAPQPPASSEDRAAEEGKAPAQDAAPGTEDGGAPAQEAPADTEDGPAPTTEGEAAPTAQDRAPGGAAQPAGGAAEQAVPAAPRGASVPEGPQTLSAEVPTADLAPGRHTLTLTSTDLAGNQTTATRTLVVDKAPSITGPDSVELTLNRADLADQAAAAAQVLASYTVEDDGTVLADGSVAPAEDTTLSLAQGTVLREGDQQVVLVATDAAGMTTTRTVGVKVVLETLTLVDGEVTATGTFHRDDALSATVADGRLTVSNREDLGAVEALITVPAPQGTTVVRVLPDGSHLPVASTWEAGTLSFTGPSKGEYLLVPPPTGEQPPADDGAGDGTGTDTGAGGSSGPAGSPATGGSAGSRTPAGARPASGSLARTGAQAGPALLAASILVTAGALLAARRRLRA